MIDVLDLTFTYSGESTSALTEVSVHIPEGQFCAVVGANGAGKSTLCHALSGFIPHFFPGTYQGSVRLDDRVISDTTLAELAGEVGLVFQNPFNQITGSRYTVREEIAFGLENLGVSRTEMLERVAQALKIVGLSGLEDRSPFALSGGQQQRLAIAAMLAMRPRLLILDEPTSQLDPAGTQELFTALRRMARTGEMTVVLAEHKLEWVASFVDRVLILAKGRIVADGPPRAVLTAPKLSAHSVGQTRYTRAATRVQEKFGFSKYRELPVTLEQAVEFFQ